VPDLNPVYEQICYSIDGPFTEVIVRNMAEELLEYVKASLRLKLKI